jgi:hypothetical protein
VCDTASATIVCAEIRYQSPCTCVCERGSARERFAGGLVIRCMYACVFVCVCVCVCRHGHIIHTPARMLYPNLKGSHLMLSPIMCDAFRYHVCACAHREHILKYKMSFYTIWVAIDAFSNCVFACVACFATRAETHTHTHTQYLYTPRQECSQSLEGSFLMLAMKCVANVLLTRYRQECSQTWRGRS